MNGTPPPGAVDLEFHTNGENQAALSQYLVREKRYRHEVQLARAAMNRWSNWRLFIFISSVAGVIWTVKAEQPIAVLGFLIGGLGLFIAAVIRHHHHTRHFERANTLLRINVEGIQRCQDEWTQREGMTGQRFIDPQHPYASDLDLFGPKSLFHWFNTARTSAGQQKVTDWLKQASANVPLKQSQEAIRELASKLDWRQKLEAEGILVEDRELSSWFAWAESFPQERKLQYLLIHRCDWTILRYAPVITILMWGLVWGSGNHGLMIMALVMTALQAMLAQGLSRVLHSQIHSALRWEHELSTSRNLLELVNEETFQAALNQDSVRKLSSASDPHLSAAALLRRLESLFSYLAVRNNPIVHFLFNTVCWWDWHCMIAIDRWKQQHGKQLRSWMEEYAILEARCSLSVIHFEHPDWVFPTVDETSTMPLSAEHLGHPLLSEKNRVTNDFSIQAPGAVTIITGSNMSGKSTFLRTVGINLILAQTGAPVCAKRFHFTPMAVFTSMRIADDMSRGVSSFYAELLRIKMIVDAAKQGMILYLVDEIFRGTNSGDRVAGAIEVLKSLSKTRSVGLVSTHDLELSKLESLNPAVFSNHHFSERFHEEGIEFDYTIQPGPATTTNARHLIRMVGIAD